MSLKEEGKISPKNAAILNFAPCIFLKTGYILISFEMV